LTASCATVSAPRAELLARMNQSRPAADARITYVETIPFGASLSAERYVLGNGLRVLLLVDRSAPVISYQTWFRVGSRHEKAGKTGLAHLFEHLMFNETEHLAAGEFDRTLERAGGETNAATWVDWTFYYENLPSAELPLAVRLEADRMAHLVLRDPQVSSEKEVVANERRYRVDDDIEGTVSELLYAAAFESHPYHWPTIGWMDDIQGFTTADCEAFYRTYYAPNNATLVIAGDLDVEQTLALVQEHYGVLSASMIPAEADAPEPEQTAERRVDIDRPTPTDKLQIGYKSPGFGERDHSTLIVLNEILFGGRSSRLYRKLITELELASEVRGSASPFRDTGLYEIWASARGEHTSEELLAVIDAELSRLTREDVPEAELEKAKNKLELSFLEGMETASGKAEQVGFYETVLGDPARVFGRLDEYRAVRPEDLRRLAAEVFDARRRTIVTVRPNGEEADDELDENGEDEADDS
jgi:zinc protease